MLSLWTYSILFCQHIYQKKKKKREKDGSHLFIYSDLEISCANCISQKFPPSLQYECCKIVTWKPLTKDWKSKSDLLTCAPAVFPDIFFETISSAGDRCNYSSMYCRSLMYCMLNKQVSSDTGWIQATPQLTFRPFQNTYRRRWACFDIA